MTPTRRSPVRIALACVLGLVVLSTNAAAQVHEHPQPAWIEDAGIAGVNAVAGGLTAAVTALIQGEPVARAFLGGAVGGGLVFVGKRIAVGSFPGAGLVGREIAATGTSMAANAGAGRGWLESIWLPIGPLWVQVAPSAGRGLRINAADVGFLIWAATRPELEFDWTSSLSGGAAIFRSSEHRILRDGRRVAGLTSGGIVLLGATGTESDDVRRHELVHVIQGDFILHSWSRPIEAWGWDRLLERKIFVDISFLSLTGTPGPIRGLREAEAQVLEFR